MSKMTVTCFDELAEVVEYKEEPESRLEIELIDRPEGYIRLSDMTERVIDGRCIFNTKKLPDGEYEPVLTTLGREVKLPKLVLRDTVATLSPCNDAFVRELSLRTLKLAKKLSALESEVSRLADSVYGSTIF